MMLLERVQNSKNKRKKKNNNNLLMKEKKLLKPKKVNTEEIENLQLQKENKE
jgi:hypothetical protein